MCRRYVIRHVVIPAKAGIQWLKQSILALREWFHASLYIPASPPRMPNFAEMTSAKK